METEQLANLISRLEDYERQHPSSYRMKVAALAILGYAYLLAVVLLLLLVVVLVLSYVRFNFVVMKVLWIPLVLVGLVLRSLWVSLPEPDGQELQLESAPKLFELISEVRASLNGPKVHRVLVSDEFNAGIVQIPRLGMFGWSRNYLVVGLPLMKALTPAEFRGVLAHEFGHLSGNHGRFSGWIYRLRQSWILVLTRVHQERQYAAFIFESFLNWYAPYFNAYSFVLARAQEYEADGYAVDLAGQETAARMLVQMNNRERALQEEFWPAFFRQSHVDPQPPRDPFAQMLSGLAQPIDRSTSEKWLLQALKVSTGYDDTHPSLSDRLAAIGYRPEALGTPEVPRALLETSSPEEVSAAEYYFEALPEDFIQKYNRLWKEQITHTWREGHRVVQETRARLSELEEKSKSAPLSLEEQWERARGLAETGDSLTAVPVLQELIRQDPKHPGAHYALGAILLEQKDEAGIELLERATQLDTTTTGDAYELIFQYLRNQGRQKEAETYRARSIQYFDERQEHLQKAVNFTYKDRLEPHDVDAEQITELRNSLRKVQSVDKAYLVRKIVEGAPEPFYILGIVPTHDDPELMDQLTSTISFSRPLIFVQLGQNKFLQPMVSSIPGAQIFPAE